MLSFLSSLAVDDDPDSATKTTEREAEPVAETLPVFTHETIFEVLVDSPSRTSHLSAASKVDP